MTDDRKLSTGDLVAAADHAVAARTPGGAAPPRVNGTDAPSSDNPTATPLFVRGDADGYRTRWSAIQTGFVDEPRHAVEEADSLVAEVVTRLAESFAGERGRLESAWERNDQVSTEDLRQAMQRYRSFFERLLSV
jgi:hypothetical protein